MTALRALAEPRRQEILRLVLDDELAAGEIAARVDVTFGAVSQHLRVLRDAGLVAVRRDGRHRYYSAGPAATGPLRDYLEQLWRGHLDQLRTLAETEAGTEGTTA
jgi:DNA-binding transcriptional ArsR family regulator